LPNGEKRVGKGLWGVGVVGVGGGVGGGGGGGGGFMGGGGGGLCEWVGVCLWGRKSQCPTGPGIQKAGPIKSAESASPFLAGSILGPKTKA